jgi:hypothetical protein
MEPAGMGFARIDAASSAEREFSVSSSIIEPAFHAAETSRTL